MEASRVKDLRHQAAVGQGDFVPDAELAGRSRQEFLDGSKATGNPVLGPLFLLLLADVDEDDQILEWLDAGRDDLADFAHLGPLQDVLGQQRTLWARLLQVVHDRD